MASRRAIGFHNRCSLRSLDVIVATVLFFTKTTDKTCIKDFSVWLWIRHDPHANFKLTMLSLQMCTQAL